MKWYDGSRGTTASLDKVTATMRPSSSSGRVHVENFMDNLLVPIPLRAKLGEAQSDGLLTMFADAHRLAVDSFERRLEQNTALLIERLERRLAEQASVLLKWSFLFWVGQLAAIAGLLGLMLPRG